MTLENFMFLLAFIQVVIIMRHQKKPFQCSVHILMIPAYIIATIMIVSLNAGIDAILGR